MRVKLIILTLLLLMVWSPCIATCLTAAIPESFVEKNAVVQRLRRVRMVKPLAGEFRHAEMPSLDRNSWFSGEFQKKCERYVEEHIGFRSVFVRAKNQADYALFRVSNSAEVVVGRDGYLYQQSYIDAYLGRDFAGKDALERTVRQAKELQAVLRARNIAFAVVLAPGKASFFPEYIPARDAPCQRKVTNYGYLRKRFEEEGINHLDMSAEFLSMKRSSPYALYPKCGIHWSNYGAAVAAVSLKRYIEGLRHVEIPGLSWSNVVVSTNPRTPDNDLEELMNLLVGMRHEPLAYPEVVFSAGPRVTSPRVLVVGDSYCWNLVWGGFLRGLFGEEEFWYYNSTVFRNGRRTGLKVSQIDVKKVVARQDCVIIVNTDANLGSLGHGFIGQALDAFVAKDGAQDDGA